MAWRVASHVRSSITIPSGGAWACSRAAKFTTSPVTMNCPAAAASRSATTSPVVMAMRRCRSASSSALRLAIRRCIASAARSARSGSSSCAAGIPKTAITASPMNFSTVPPYRVISSRIAAKKRAISARIGSGSSCLVTRVEPARSANSTVTTRRSAAPAPCSGVPHCRQNCAPEGLARPQVGQRCTSAVPQRMQNCACSGLVVPHCGQRMDGSTMRSVYLSPMGRTRPVPTWHPEPTLARHSKRSCQVWYGPRSEHWSPVGVPAKWYCHFAGWRNRERLGRGRTTQQTTSQVMAVDTVRLLQTLSDAFGVTGFEDEVRETLRALVEPYADEIRTDVLGNLLVTRRGGSGFTVMLDAHLDEIGLIVDYVDERGFLHFVTLGGWGTRILPAQAVMVRTRDGRKVRGVIGSQPPHILKSEERDKPIPLESLFIDVGASSADQAAGLGIRVGDPVVLGHSFEVVREGWVLGKAFDDRAGCAVLVKVLEELAGTTPEATLVMNFAVSEETGLRGARTAAFQIDPQVALAVEATVAADVPGVAPPRQPAGVGKGAAITLADQSSIVSQRMVRALEALAQRHEIRYQLKLPLFGGTDAGAIQTSRAGVLAGVVSIPVRYIHSPVSLMWLDDFEQVVRLVTAFAREAKTLFGQ